MSNAVGCAPVLEMMRRGVRVGLGTDGYAADMFESMKSANLLLKHHSGDPRAAWAEPPAMLFQENAAIATECFGRPVGKLVPGAHADIILVDYDPPTPMNAENLGSHILSASLAALSDGSDRRPHRHGIEKMLAIDEQEVMAKSRAAAAEMWKRF